MKNWFDRYDNLANPDIVLSGCKGSLGEQVEFIQSKNLGYSKDHVILFSKEGKINNGLEGFLYQLKSIPGVVNASTLGGDFTALGNITSDLTWEGKKPDVVLDFGEVGVGYDLIETLDIKLKEGRSFSRNHGSDSTKIIFNDAAIAAMALKDPVGKTVQLWEQEREIIGVVHDFHTESHYEQLKPCFLLLSPYVNNIAVKIRAGNEKETLQQIQDFYETFNPENPFESKFMDQAYDAMYASENRVHILSRYFAGIAIIIACLGLFGLTAFTAERRMKEIGIRKVLGSSTGSIVKLLTVEFLRLVLVAIIFSLPVSYVIAENWLNEFAYRIDLRLWYFVAAGMVAFVIAWFTVALQTVKAARINPTQCLKEE